MDTILIDYLFLIFHILNWFAFVSVNIQWENGITMESRIYTIRNAISKSLKSNSKVAKKFFHKITWWMQICTNGFGLNKWLWTYLFNIHVTRFKMIVTNQFAYFITVQSAPSIHPSIHLSNTTRYKKCKSLEIPCINKMITNCVKGGENNGNNWVAINAQHTHTTHHQLKKRLCFEFMTHKINMILL